MSLHLHVSQVFNFKRFEHSFASTYSTFFEKIKSKLSSNNVFWPKIGMQYFTFYFLNVWLWISCPVRLLHHVCLSIFGDSPPVWLLQRGNLEMVTSFLWGSLNWEQLVEDMGEEGVRKKWWHPLWTINEII